MCGNVGVNVLLLHIKIEFRRVCFTMWVESVATVNMWKNVGVNILLLYIKN